MAKRKPQIQYILIPAEMVAIVVVIALIERSRNQTAPRIATNNQAQVIAANTPVPNSQQPPSMRQLLYGRAR